MYYVAAECRWLRMELSHYVWVKDEHLFLKMIKDQSVVSYQFEVGKLKLRLKV